MGGFRALFRGFDIPLALSALALALLGLVTMYSSTGGEGYFVRQALWIGLAFAAMLAASMPDYRFLRTGNGVIFFYAGVVALLALVFLWGEITLGAQSRFDIGFFSLQPAELAKLALIMVLAKYFSKRHVEIGHFRHIFVSGVYTFVLFTLVFLQPDFGSALILGCIWFGMILVAGISWKHLALVFAVGTVSFAGLWNFGGVIGFQEYQKQRILTFLNPLADIQGTGYHVYQSTIAVGSGQFLGKGVGYGTQSKLQFLPEYQTDFIFAAFAEEWGFVGVCLLFGLFGAVVARLLALAFRAGSNFGRLFGVGVAVLVVSHFTIHVGMNIGLLPVTGTTVPFLSYGGSHLLVEFIALGMLMGMRKAAPGGALFASAEPALVKRKKR